MPETVDATFILEGLVGALEHLPATDDPVSQNARETMIEAARNAAKAVEEVGHGRGGLKDARSYVGDEWQNEILLAFLGRDGAAKALGIK